MIDPEKRIAHYVAALTYQHLTRSSLVREDPVDEPLIYVWQLPDRVVLIVNPLRVKNLEMLLKPRFEHHLSTVLQGRRVVVTNHRGIFLQVGYYAEPPQALEARPLDLSRQSSPLHVPIGATARGDLWLSIADIDAVLIGGARRMGKTNLLHGWIAALLQGQRARLVLFDGKGGVEFARYADRPRCQVLTEALGPVLAELYGEMKRRFDLLKAAGVASLAEYNRDQGEGAELERVVLIVDELAFALQEPGVEDVLVDLTARGGAVGLHPVLATQRPSSDTVTPRLKGNLVTRIALPVPDRASSMVVLDRSGAETLAKTPGRLLIAHAARLVEAQAFLAPSMVAEGKSLPLASPRLTERERRLAETAIEQGGWYRAKEIARATALPLEFVVDVAQRWELLGWLTTVQRNALGHKLGRRVTPALEAEFGEQGNLGNLANLA